MYPDVASITPSKSSKGGSIHQKHPPPKYAFSYLSFITSSLSIAAHEINNSNNRTFTDFIFKY